MTNQTTALQIVQEQKPTLTELVKANMPIGTSTEQAELALVREISNIEHLLQLKPDLKNCKPESFLIAVKQAIADGLSLSPNDGLVYLVPGRVKKGIVNGKDVYEWIVTYDRTANGRLSIAFQSGAILDVKKPVCEFNEHGRVTSVTVEFLVPSYPQPRWEVVTYGEPYFKRWADASGRKNQGKPNALYFSFNGGIDPEFAASKAIRHGLGKRGTNKNSPRHQVMQNAVKAAEAAQIISPAVALSEASEENGNVSDAVLVTTYEVIETKPDANKLPI